MLDRPCVGCGPFEPQSRVQTRLPHRRGYVSLLGIDIDSTEERARIEARSLKFQGSTPEVQQRLEREREEKEREEKRAAREARFGKQAGPGYDVRVFPQIFKDLHVRKLSPCAHGHSTQSCPTSFSYAQWTMIAIR